MKAAIVTLFVFLSVYCPVISQQCTISGKVINRKSKNLLIRKHTENYKVYYEKPVRIPIKKGSFTYSFSYNTPEAYEIVFEDEIKEGVWKPITFFPAAEGVQFTLHPFNEWEKNSTTGGKLNDGYSAYQQIRKQLFDAKKEVLRAKADSLRKADQLESPAYKDVVRQLSSVKKGDHDALVPIYQQMDEMNKTHARYTATAKEVYIDPSDSLKNEELRWKYEYIREHVSLASYFLLWSDAEKGIKESALTAKLVEDAFPLFKEAYPDHLYTTRIAVQLAGLHTIRPGNKYIDIKAPTLAGDTLVLSGIINNRIALIDFWASWCGPCIAKSRKVVSIYNEYKSKGFEIAGIAREFKNTDALKKRLGIEQFPWTNLVDLDDKLAVWNKYGIGDGVGMMVLVDKQGVILAIDPSPEMLKKILAEKLD